MLYAFCALQFGCTDKQKALGSGPQTVVAGADGAYYGTTPSTVYRADPVTRTIRTVYQFSEFPDQYLPTSWLKVGPDGALYGGYLHTRNENSDWVSEGLFRLSPTGEFTVIFDESKYKNFVSNAPVQDSLGNWIGIKSTYPYVGGPSSNFVYKITPGGDFQILHVFAAYEVISAPNYEPVLAAGGNLYGVFSGGIHGSSGALYRLAPDGTFSIVHTFNDLSEGEPQTPITVGPDGALYGVLMRWRDNYMNSLYRISLDGQFTNLGDFGPDNPDSFLEIFRKLTLMPDGQFYGSARYGVSTGHGNFDADVLFRLSPAGEYTQLYVNPNVVQNTGISMMIRGFDNALYGADPSNGKYNGGVLFRYVPPPVQ